jgi:hypothetical protein
MMLGKNLDHLDYREEEAAVDLVMQSNQQQPALAMFERTASKWHVSMTFHKYLLWNHPKERSITENSAKGKR